MINHDLKAYPNTVIAPYNRLLTEIVRDGFETPITKMLLDKHVTFDLRALNIGKGNWQMIMPAQRGSMAGSVKYAAAEAVWYLAHTRDIDLIVEYGKIWKTMVDDKGKINSNYGYQLTHNQNIMDQLELLYQTGHTSLAIISPDNMLSTTDLVCNNRVDLSLSMTGTDAFNLSATVNARSIDVIFGLPYDMFAAQGLMCMVADYLQRAYAVTVSLADLTFKMSNVHWYLRQNPSEEELAHLSSEVLAIPYRQTPYAINGLIYRMLSNDEYQDLIKKYRQSMVSHQMTARMFNSRNIDELYPETKLDGPLGMIGRDTICVADNLEQINEFIEGYCKPLANPDGDNFLKHWKTVMRPRLEANKFDRKVVWTSDSHASVIIYVVYYKGSYYVVRF